MAAQVVRMLLGLGFQELRLQSALSRRSAMAAEVVDVCKCTQYGGRLLCKVCVDRIVALALNEKPPNELENKVRFLQAYEPGPLCLAFRGDVRFLGIDQEPVFAHRFILAGKSSIFKFIFDVVMRNGEDEVNVPDTRAPVLRSMVNYCYTADITFTKEAPAEEVLMLARVFDIKELASVCASELSRGINNENMCDGLRLAHVCDVKKLEAVADRFFRKITMMCTPVVERIKGKL